MVSKLLFAQTDIFRVSESQKAALKEQLRKAPEAWFTSDTTGLIDEEVNKFSLRVPVLEKGAIEVSHSEADVDVSRDPRRFIRDRTRPFYIKGARMTFHVPFKGDPSLFDVQPTTFTLNPPRATIKSSELLFVFELLEEEMATIQTSMENELQKVETYLASLRPSAEILNKELLQIAATEIAKRRRSAEARKEAVTALPYAVRAAAPAGVAREAARNSIPSTVQAQESSGWDVFISHAWEDKDTIAAPLASAFKDKGLRVWYDSAVLTVGDSLTRKIDEGLAKSRFGVVVLSKSFFAKHWPQQELIGLSMRESSGQKVVLPVWHDITVEDIRTYSLRLADKVGVSTHLGLDEVVQQLLAAITL